MMKIFRYVSALVILTLCFFIHPPSGHAGVNEWTGSGPFATGLGNRVINALAISSDGATVYAGTGSGTVLIYSITPPDLTVTKSNNVSGATTLGNSWTWDLHVANNSALVSATFNSGDTILADDLDNSGNLTYGSPVVGNGTNITNIGGVSCGIAGNTLTCTATGAVTIGASGSFDVSFTVTPGATGSYTNPRSGGACAVDPNNVVPETNGANKNCNADSVAVTAADQAKLTLNAGSPLTYGSTEALGTTGGSGTGAVTYSAGTSTGCSVTGSTLSATNAGGTCSVTATKAADANYNEATSPAVTITLQKAEQTITIGTHAPASGALGTNFNVAATSSSGLGVAITAAGACGGSGTGAATITMTGGTGKCAVYYDQGGDGDYNAAAELSDTTTAVYPTHVVMPDATGNGNVILDTGSPGCAFISWGKETAGQVGGDTSYTYPYGLVEFTLNCPAADVTITFPGSVAGMTYRKYGPTPDNNTPHWYDFMYDGSTGAQINGDQVVLHFLDAQRGDDVLTPDGKIVDQGGPGQVNGSVAVPTMNEWGMMIFMFLAWFGVVYYLRRRRKMQQQDMQ
jgi:trimeric autotransporter adhesin